VHALQIRRRESQRQEAEHVISQPAVVTCVCDYDA
jgi:hypothetical protein